MIRYQAGDEAAFEEIYGRYSKKIYGFIMRRLANPDTSAELFQETFLRLHRGRGLYRLEMPFKPWLYTIANTLIRDRVKAKVHCCLASLIGAFLFGVSRSPRSTENLFIGSFVVMLLLSPAIYLQGASHNHGFGVIAFATAGTYVGSIVGMGLGLFIRRKLSFHIA